MRHLFLILTTLLCSGAYAQIETQQIVIPDKFAGRLEPGHELRVNSQYEVKLFYVGSGLQKPRFMAIGPNNVLYVADIKANQIFAIPDFDGDGLGDSTFVAAPSVDSAHSLFIWRDTMYVAEPDRVRKFIDMNQDGTFESEQPFITGIHSSGPYNHYTRTVFVDTVGRNIYLSVGASCNACREENPQRGTIMQFNLSGSASRVYATGLRNAIGLSIDPELNQLWATNADRDGIGDDIPPEIVSPIVDNGFYGWPFAHSDIVWVDFTATPEYQAILPITAADSAKVASMQVAPIELEAHSTPMGIIFYTDPRIYFQAPPKTLLIARHGSSKGGRPIGLGYDVLRFQQDKDSKLWTRDTFLAGFLTDSIEYSYWGRPCGIVQDSTGEHIYLSSDAGTAAIYRMTLKDFNDVDERPDNAAPTIHPNPARNNFTLRTSSDARIKLHSVLGNEMPVTIERIAQGYSVSVRGVSNGLYMCTIEQDARRYTLPVILW